MSVLVRAIAYARCSSASCSSSSRLVCCRGRASALRRGWDLRRSSRCCWEPPVRRSRCGASPRSCSPTRALWRRSIRQLVVRGSYDVVRNLMYLGAGLALAGVYALSSACAAGGQHRRALVC